MKLKFNTFLNLKNIVMSKTRKTLTLIFSFVFANAFAQTNSLDKQLQKVDQSSVTSGIIYNRVNPLADLCVFNIPAEKPHNTANCRFFEQALFELHKLKNDKMFSYFNTS